MGLYTSTYFRNLAKNKSDSQKRKLVMESTMRHDYFDIFLSHSFLDKEEVEGIYYELEAKGYKVYVDWIIDPHLDRKNVTQSSSELIRSRLKSSKSLLLAISTNAELSKWIPWELGYVDGNTNKCALIPVSRGTNSEKAFYRTEYLKIYPYIKLAEVSNNREIYIVESANKYAKYNDWLKFNYNIEYKNQNIDVL